MDIKKQRMTKDLDILMATQRARFTDNPFSDAGPLATLEKTISFIATLEGERDAALAEVERLKNDVLMVESLFAGDGPLITGLKADVERKDAALRTALDALEYNRKSLLVGVTASTTLIVTTNAILAVKGAIEERGTEVDPLRAALTGVMPMVEKYVNCNHDWNDCENVRKRDAARAALKGTS